MPATPKIWATGKGGNTPITAAELNRIEAAIRSASRLHLPVSPMARAPYPASDVTSAVATGTEPVFASPKVFKPDNSTGRFRINTNLTNSLSAAHWFSLDSGMTDAPDAYQGFEVEFYLDDDRFGIGSYVQGACDYQIYVDDMPLWPEFGTYPVSGGAGWLVVQFATSRVRKIRVLLGNNSFSGIWLPGAAETWAAPARFKVPILGDSIVAGTPPTTEGVLMAGALCGAIASAAGWECPNLGQGGTGYTKNGENYLGKNVYGHSSRIAALTAVDNPDAIIVYGSANDAADTTPQVDALTVAANACWAAIKAAHPGVPLIVAGAEPWTPPGWTESSLDNTNDVLKAAAAVSPHVDLFIDQRGKGWFTGTGSVGAPEGDGNQDFFVSSDGVHLSKAGFQYLAERLVGEIKGQATT
jgi:lysophospholipase L1-like esterase